MELNNEILSDITVFNKYAKYDKDKGRRETWEELVTRNMDMHIKKYPHIEDEIRSNYEYVFAKKVLPSMRSLQFGGTPIEMGHNRIYNCAYLPLDDISAFSELMFLLLGGTGGGYSVQSHHVAKLPVVSGPNFESRRFIVGDSIEGWADAVKVLIEAYFLGKHYPKFDFTDIREKGAELITTGGKAPGPEPLKACISSLQYILNKAVGRKLTPIEAHDMGCIVADAVLAGGIRRAALITLFDRDDESMLSCKSTFNVTMQATGKSRIVKHSEDYSERQYQYFFECNGRQYFKHVPSYLIQDENNPTGSLVRSGSYLVGTIEWWFIEPQRGRANNSAVLPRGEVTQEEFMKLMQRVEDSGAGEPGVYWTSNKDWGTNPCCEIALRAFQFCNLCEVNASDIVSQEDFEARCRAASFIGTLQAGYTDFHYLRPIWRETTEKEALIGVGMTGIGSGVVLDYDMSAGAREVIEENKRAAKLLSINPAQRTTTVKPSGTSSLVLGSSSGIHAWHNDFYIRRMRVGYDEALYGYMKARFPELVEDDLMSPTQGIISFPQKAPKGSILRHESPMDLLARVRRVNKEWVHKGHISGDNTHNVSCTISIRDGEWKEIADWMWNNRNDYNGISVLPYNGGTYVQAPFEDITEEAYLALEKHLKAIDLSEVYEATNNTDLAGEAACAGGACEITF